MEAKDIISMIIGFIVMSLGLIPFLEKWKVINLGLSKTLENVLAANIAIYLVAGLGLYLVVESFIEITQSNAIGSLSLIIAGIITLIGLIPVLSQFGVLPFNLPFTLSQIIFQMIFIVEGIFLIIAGFAMEL